MSNDYTELDLLYSPIEEGLTVVEASAGTGKTYSISHLVPRLLIEGVLPDLSKLLLVTFTNDAARELSDRVRRVLARLAAPPSADETTKHPHVAGLRTFLDASPAARRRLDRALLDLDLLAVSTIHAFCQRTLQAEGSLCGVPVMPEVITEDGLYLEPLVRDAWLSRLATDPVLAAIATAAEWGFDDTSKVVKAVRKVGTPDNVRPTPTSFAQLRQQIDMHVAALRDTGTIVALTSLLFAVTWKAGGSLNEAQAFVRAVSQGTPDSVEFWSGVRYVANIEAKLGLQGKAQKTATAAVLASAWISAARRVNDLLPSLLWSLQLEIARVAIEKVAGTLHTHRLITQDGLIDTLHLALHRTGDAGAAQSKRLADHLADKYHVALVDESQDTDPRQFAIFQRIFLLAAPRRRLILVGDPKQAIYGFRGADVATYLRARDAAAARYTLTHTHRAPPRLVDAVNACFSRERAFHHASMPFRPAQSALSVDRQLFRNGQPCSRLEVWLADATQREFLSSGKRVPALSGAIASTIVDLLERGELRETSAEGVTTSKRVSCRDFAVLVATHFQAQAMTDALLQRGVPAVITSGADVFSSDEAQDIRILLRAIIEPRRIRRVRAALATRLLGLTAQELAEFDADTGTSSSAGAFSVWTDRFEIWHQIWHTRGLAALLAALEGESSTRESDGAGSSSISHRLALLPLTGERRVTNYRHVTDLLLEASRTEVTRPAELVRWLGQQIARAEARSDAEERQLQLSTDRAAVQVVTMHKAKGLEYPLVFCPYLAESLKAPEGLQHLPEKRGDPADTLWHLNLLDDNSRAERVAQKIAAEMEERLRLAYVALTRAQVRVWTCSYTPSTKSNFDSGSALDWLLRPAADVTAHTEYSGTWVRTLRPVRDQKHGQALLELGAKRGGDEPDAIITVCSPPKPNDARYQSSVEGAKTTVTAADAPPVPHTWRVTSFSSLTRERHAHGAPQLSAVAAAPAPEPLSAGVSVPAAECTFGFFTAPAGAAVGTVVHDWIETWDFGPVDADALRQHLAYARLPAVSAGSWENTLTELFGTLARIHLPGLPTVPLAELCSNAQSSEWHFHLPLADALSVTDIARCFDEHAAPAHRAYAPILASLGEERFQGLLQGFIDRLVRHGNAWGVIDWKTNRLGESLGDYSSDALLQCAMDAHYLLQTHLYLIALRRYLRAIGVENGHIAGAWLVFLRAIEPGTARGVLHIQPPTAMLDALERLFAAPEVALL